MVEWQWSCGHGSGSGGNPGSGAHGSSSSSSSSSSSDPASVSRDSDDGDGGWIIPAHLCLLIPGEVCTVCLSSASAKTRSEGSGMQYRLYYNIDDGGNGTI